MPIYSGTQTDPDVSIANSQINTYADSLVNGTLEIWTTGGTPRTPTGTKLFTYNLGADPYGPASNKTANLNAPINATAAATGTPAIWRFLRTGGVYVNGGTFSGASEIPVGEEVPLSSAPITIP